MASQVFFDRLRRDCSDRLKGFIAEAHETERLMENLELPVGIQQANQFLTKRQAEYDACHEYLLAAGRLARFLQEEPQYLQ